MLIGIGHVFDVSVVIILESEVQPMLIMLINKELDSKYTYQCRFKKHHSIVSMKYPHLEDHSKISH